MDDLSEKDTIIRMMASLMVCGQTLQDIEDPEERIQAEMEQHEHETELDEIVEVYAAKNKLNLEQTVEELVSLAAGFIESGKYDQEVMEMLAEDGDLDDFVDKSKLH